MTPLRSVSVSRATFAPSPIGATLGVAESTLAGALMTGSTSSGGGSVSTPIVGGRSTLDGGSTTAGDFFVPSVLASSPVLLSPVLWSPTFRSSTLSLVLLSVVLLSSVVLGPPLRG